MGLPQLTIPEYTLKLPSDGKEITYRPFLVKEEKLLLIAMESEDEEQILRATKRVIQSCVHQNLDVDNMPTFDFEYVFLWLRAKAKGEEINLKYKCPKCDGEIPLAINIEDVKIKKTKSHSTKIELTDNLGVVFKYPSLSLQFKIDNHKFESEVEKIFTSVLSCIDFIYDAKETYSTKDHTEKELTDFLESLTDVQFQKLAKFFETMPILKHEAVLVCKNKIKEEGKKKEKICDFLELITLEGLQSFFD